MNKPLTDDERFPLLSAQGRKMLQFLREHPHAPRFNFRCGDRLSREGLQQVRDYETALHSNQNGWNLGETPAWLRGFVDTCLADVPIYRRACNGAEIFSDFPTFSRQDLHREPWSFVPDSLPLDELMVYTTNGTTGNILSILSHPIVASKYLPVLRSALATQNVYLEGGDGRVSVVLVGSQTSTYTYATVSSYLNQAGFVKINLNPNDWRHPQDRVKFLDACCPEIYSGDPLSFLELARLPLETRPKALVSTSMKLFPELKRELEAHFECPVIEVYSMNEARLIAVATPTGYQILTHDLFVEILDPDGAPCPPGIRGEVVLSGGWNPFLPLLRYRTGDFSRLDFQGSIPLLVDLEGRQPVVFVNAEGNSINNIDVTYALKPFPLAQFQLHQAEDGSLELKVRGSHVDLIQIRNAVLDLFGQNQPLAIEEMADALGINGKVIQFSSSFERKAG